MGLAHIPLGSLVVHPMKQKKLKLVAMNTEMGYLFLVPPSHLLTFHLADSVTS